MLGTHLCITGSQLVMQARNSRALAKVEKDLLRGGGQYVPKHPGLPAHSTRGRTVFLNSALGDYCESIGAPDDDWLRIIQRAADAHEVDEGTQPMPPRWAKLLVGKRIRYKFRQGQNEVWQLGVVKKQVGSSSSWFVVKFDEWVWDKLTAQSLWHQIKGAGFGMFASRTSLVRCHRSLSQPLRCMVVNT